MHILKLHKNYWSIDWLTIGTHLAIVSTRKYDLGKDKVK